MIKVSVIMPAYNVEKLLEKSVRSVMEQTLDDIELIVINDASTDHTWQAIEQLRQKYGPKLKGINLTKNGRQGAARNRGIREAAGEYIAFVDSDDWIKSDMLEKLYHAMIENNADMAGTCKYFMFYSDDNIVERQDKREMTLAMSGKPANSEIRDMYFRCAGPVWNNLYKKKIIVENEIWFPEGVSYEDNYFVNLYLAYVTKYIHVDEPFYYYRQNPNSTVHRKDYSQLRRVDVEKMMLEQFIRRGLLNDVKEAYEVACVQRWYINTLGIYFARFGKEAIKLSVEMGKEFRSYFPTYKKNKYFKTDISLMDRVKLSLFEISPYLLYVLYRIKNRA